MLIMNLTFTLLICLTIVHAEAVHRNNLSRYREDHEIKVLPNLYHKDGDLNFRQYAGHLKLDSGEKLFYWYTEAQHRPETAPIVLWLNGGPGCSSLGGFFTENGPFVVVGDLRVRRNKYSWNRHANIVWLESPAGVGFSTPFRHHPYNDDYTASRNYEFLVHFFNKYPELKNRDFYITGESYAGHYIPTLTSLLIKSPIENVKFKGFAVGNPTTDSVYDSNAYLDYYYTHGLVSLEKYNEVKTVCGTNLTCFFFEDDCTDQCADIIDNTIAESDEEKFNEYYIYGDKCLLKNKQGRMLKAHRRHSKNKHVKVLRRGKIGPCADQYTESYLNLKSVQRAIHAIGSETSKVPWEDCNNDILYIYSRMPSMLPLYQSFMGKGLKILVYSGDADSVVNFIGTERWITEGLKLKVRSEWKAWFGPDEQLAGYVQEYEGLTYKTVKGAGHMVPATRPLHGLRLFECFIFDDCDKFDYPIDPFEEIAEGEEPAKMELESRKNSSNLSTLLVMLCSIIGIGAVLFAWGRFSKRSSYMQLPQDM